MDKRFCDCCNKEIIPKESWVWVVFHDEHLRPSLARDLIITTPQGRDLCLDCYRKIGEMVHIELPKETLLDKIEKSITGLAEALRNVFTGGGGHDQNRNEEGPEQSDQGDD